MATAPKKGMTIRAILKASTPSRKDAAASVNILARKTKTGVKGNPITMAKTSSRVEPDGKKKPNASVYMTAIEVLPNGTSKVSCSCDDFLYTWEYALAKAGAARIEYGNGEPPREKNPKLIPGACKHVIAFARDQISKKAL